MKVLKSLLVITLLALSPPSKAACTGCSISATATFKAGATAFTATAPGATQVQFFVDGGINTTLNGSSPFAGGVGFFNVGAGTHTWFVRGVFPGGTADTAATTVMVTDTVACSEGNTGCAIQSGGVVCWGQNDGGQVGNGTAGADVHTPVGVVNAGGGATSVACGDKFNCAVVSGNAVCWGHNANGQIGDGTLTNRSVGQGANGLGATVVQVVTREFSTCALLNTGGVKCWGNNSDGQLGDGTTTEYHSPHQVTGLTSGVVKISLGIGEGCALLNTGAVQCWGQFDTRSGAPLAPVTATPVAGLSSGVTDISVGYLGHQCAIQAGIPKCWGTNYAGELGNGNQMDSILTPVVVSGITNAQNVSAGFLSTCVTTTAHTAKCWGYDNEDQLGDGVYDSTNSGNAFFSTTPVGGWGWVDTTILIYPSFFGGIAAHNGHVFTWGTGSFYALGNGSTANQYTSPVQIF